MLQDVEQFWHDLRRGKAALVDGNLANLNKLVRKGKADADVLEDRLRKVRNKLCRDIANRLRTLHVAVDEPTPWQYGLGDAHLNTLKSTPWVQRHYTVHSSRLDILRVKFHAAHSGLVTCSGSHHLVQVDEVRAAIEGIPDGVHGRTQLSPSKLRPSGEASPSRVPVHIEARTYGEGYFTSTAESSKFRQVSRRSLLMPLQKVINLQPSSYCSSTRGTCPARPALFA